MNYISEGSEDTCIELSHTEALIDEMLRKIGTLKRVLLVPPDITRSHSGAGNITQILYHKLRNESLVEILPAIGTHTPMTSEELGRMFPGIPLDVFREHNWRKDLVHLGEVPPEVVRNLSKGRVDYPISCEINQIITSGQWDRIFSIGQLMPHEVAGIANHNKNILVGTGGQDTINKTHFLSAVCGMETIMGRAKTPVREIFNYMATHFLPELPVTYILTVREADEQGAMVTRGLYAGDGEECFLRGAELCQKVNLHLLESPLEKVVTYLDPDEFKSTWLGNKAIYRTRMAIADGGELIILAPGMKTFGEDKQIDLLIRKYGYSGTEQILDNVREHNDLADTLSAAAHLIHGSSEGRFTITYCTNDRGNGEGLTRKEIESVGYRFADISTMMRHYDPDTMRNGFNTIPVGEEVFFIANPALGLWGLKSLFEDAL